MGINTFDPAATELIVRSAQGNLRLCRNLCYGSLIESCRETKKIVTITHDPKARRRSYELLGQAFGLA